MNKLIRWGLIGVGGVGALHRASLEKLTANGEIEFVAVADPSAARMPREKAELESRGVQWHMDYLSMLDAHPELDAVTIATPIPFHFEMAKACMQRGLFVNLEKPPVPLLSQLETLLALDTADRVSVGFQMIGSRCMQALKKAITDSKLGEVHTIRSAASWPRLDNYYNRASWAGKMTLEEAAIFDGPATNALAHLINGISFLANTSTPQGFSCPTEIEAELYRARPIQSYDTACIRGSFGSKLKFSIALTHAIEETIPFSIDVSGTHGWARLSDDGTYLQTSCGIDLKQSETTQTLIDRCYQDMIEVIRGQRSDFQVNLKDTRAYVMMTNAMLTSAGRIQDINEDYLQQYQSEGQNGYHVTNLKQAIETNRTCGKLFSEQSQGWAHPYSRPVSLKSYSGLSHQDLIDASKQDALLANS